MKILSIETSCDETAISIIEAKPNSLKKNGRRGGFKNPQFNIIANTVISQINLHKKYGGVFPALAQREHIKNLLPILEETLKKAKLISKSENQIPEEKVREILEREPESAEKLIKFTKNIEIPDIDAIAVTRGPGLEPALWTGLNFAKALALIWDKPFIPVNHMEGHIASVFAPQKQKKRQNTKTQTLNKLQSTKHKAQKIKFPSLALLISGGHTELVLMKDWMKYETIGQTRDDAVGEAYDKVARMMGLPYPGGPEISKLSEQHIPNHKRRRRTSASVDISKLAEQFVGRRTSHNSSGQTTTIVLPRPMINSDDFDFSFSGLKTAVLYTIKNIPKLTPKIKKEISHEFENAVVDVLLTKTKKAIEKYKIKTLILGGGVTANKRIRKSFKDLESENLSVLIPEIKHSTDNAIMIGIAGYFRYLNKQFLDPNKTGEIRADGNMKL